MSDETKTAFHLQARKEAHTALARFKDEAYDWYSPDDAGRWSDYFPPVLLGAEDKARFLYLLEEFAELPIAKAKYLHLHANTKDHRKRTQEELDNTPDAVIIGTPRYPIDVRQEGMLETHFWSGVFDPLPPVDNAVIDGLVRFDFIGEETTPIDRGFEESALYRYDYLEQAISIANGKFTAGCGFYSVLDESPILYHENRKKAQQEPERFALVFFDFHI